MLVERADKDVELFSGTSVPYYSDEHIDDLLRRLDELDRWRKRYRRGTDARATCTRMIQRLRVELRHVRSKLHPVE